MRKATKYASSARMSVNARIKAIPNFMALIIAVFLPMSIAHASAPYPTGNRVTDENFKLIWSGSPTFTSTPTFSSVIASSVTVTTATITTLNSPIVRYSRPNLVWISTNAVAISSNTGTTNESCILFPDGGYRCVTENNSTADQYRLWQATATANFTSGTEDSGLRSTYIRTANTRYLLYAVKSSINSANYVIVGDTITPVVANYSTLNTAYGTNGWVYLGCVFNGDQGSSTNTILKFVKSGAHVEFFNATSGANVANDRGVRLATTASATTLTYTYAAGTASGQIPNNIKIVRYSGHLINSSGNSGCTDSTGNIRFMFNDRHCAIETDASLGLLVEIGGANKADIFLTGFIDDALTDGAGNF